MIRYNSQLFKDAGVFRYFFRISIVSNIRTLIEVSLASNGDTFLCIESFFMTSQRICRENNFFATSKKCDSEQRNENKGLGTKIMLFVSDFPILNVLKKPKIFHCV